MKKAVMAIWIVCLLFLFGCKEDAPSIVGVWKADVPMFGTETDLYEIDLIFYDGIEAQENQTKTDGSKTQTKSYNFDYELKGDILSVYAGPTPVNYTVVFGEDNGTETMTLTAEDGTVYSYILSSRRTPGIRQY